jgi:hypothetical protein
VGHGGAWGHSRTVHWPRPRIVPMGGPRGCCDWWCGEMETDFRVESTLWCQFVSSMTRFLETMLW